MIALPTEPGISSLDDLYEGKAGSLVLLQGGNFSGRSEMIRLLAQMAVERGELGIVIPPELHPAFSGVTASVADELELHLGHRNSQPLFWTLAEQWGLLALGNRHPLTLSGGQQAMLGILCKLALRPRIFGLDGALEQLDPRNLSRVLEALSSGDLFSEPSVALISHNGPWPEQRMPLHTIHAEDCAPPYEEPKPPGMDVAEFAPGMAVSSSLEFKNASFRYPGGAPVFSNLDLQLHPGRIYRLAGPNGAGKSTFAKLLCGILRLTSGSLFVNGKLFDPYPKPGTLAQLHFQNPDTQLFGTSVAGEIETLPPERRASALAYAGLRTFMGTHPFDLPFVLRKRLALTLTLHANTPWLIFDEPTVGLDRAGQKAVCEALIKLKKAGFGILLISHNPALDDLLDPEILDFLTSAQR
ncbi:MAG: ATP-binding cassette domain-containing protein [Verrucomicrobiales bacterium]|nr:ATP-binding cassette domain-containing protein [Verrucomicrobiales bacterium]